MSDPLPSIDDFTNKGELPSLDEFITEEAETELPSVEQFVVEEEEEVLEEAVQTLEDANGESFAEVKDIVPPWPELVQMVNDIRRDIPEIPEIKYYDKELQELAAQIEQVESSIPTVPEIRYYDAEVEAICDQIDNVKHNIANLPEVKYYDEQLQELEGKLVGLKESLPEVKYYDTDINSLDKKIEEVRESIPKFPKWVNEVNEVPDFTWIGKTFSVIDDDFIKVGDNIKSIKERIDQEVTEISENFDLKDFENKVEFENVRKTIEETKNKIYEELKETAIKIWDHHHQFKDDDRKLKKQILSQYNKLNQNIQKQIAETQEKNYDSYKVFENYLGGLREEVENLPKVKYYDDTISDLKKNVSRDISKLNTKFEDASTNIVELYKLVEQIKGEQQTLSEGLLNEPPDVNNSDPLTPIDQNFVTIDQLQKHYKLFVERVQHQLATFGGGGSVELQYLEDITGIATNLSAYDGMYLTVDTSQAAGKNFKFASVSAGSTIWESNSTGIVTTANVGIGTTNAATALYVKGSATITGDLDVTGDIVYDEQTARNLNVTGIATINTLGVTGITTVGILTAYESITIGSTNVLTALSGKTSIGLAIALG